MGLRWQRGMGVCVLRVGGKCGCVWREWVSEDNVSVCGECRSVAVCVWSV